MDTNTILLIVGAAILGLVIGFFISKAMVKSNASKLVKNAKKEAATILKDARHDGEAAKKIRYYRLRRSLLS